MAEHETNINQFAGVNALATRIEELTGRWVSDSTICSRIRDLRLDKYGAHQIITERLPNSHTCRYRLVGK